MSDLFQRWSATCQCHCLGIYISIDSVLALEEQSWVLINMQ